MVSILLAVLVFGGCSRNESDKMAANGGGLADIALEVGIDFVHDPGVDGTYFEPESIGSGAAFFDFDNDGYLDIYLITGRRHDSERPDPSWSKNQLFRQNHDGTFVNVTEESGLGDDGYGMGVAVGDIENDGDLDVYITNFGPDQLYENLGDGRFRNITKAAGIKSDEWGCSTTFVDYDLDGFMDIYVVNYMKIDSTVRCKDRSGRLEYCGPGVYPGIPDVLLRNNGDRTFTDVSFPSRIGIPERPGLGVVTADFNFDGHPDIYVSNDGEDNFLWLNRKDGTFADMAPALGTAVNRLGTREAGMGIAVGDVSGKLTQDIFVTHIEGESNTLYLNHGALGFEDAAKTAGFERMDMLPYTGFGVGLVDLNLDACLDIVIGNGRIKRLPGIYTEGDSLWAAYSEPNFIFLGEGGGKFRNVSADFSEYSAPRETTRGIAFADYDNDGDIDFLVNSIGRRARLYRNDIERKGNWLSLTLFDPAINRIAVGARIILTSGTTQLTSQVMPGYSFLSSNDFRVHFGLGQLKTVDKATVYWPGGFVEEFKNIAINQYSRLEKGAGKAVAN